MAFTVQSVEVKNGAKLALYDELVSELKHLLSFEDTRDGCADDDPLPCLYCRTSAVLAKAEAIERGEG